MSTQNTVFIDHTFVLLWFQTGLAREADQHQGAKNEVEGHRLHLKRYTRGSLKSHAQQKH